MPRSTPPPGAKGLILAQVDGLAMKQLCAALKKGRMPFLKSMLKDNAELISLYSGVPSATPAAQAELMFGVKSAVPAFQFYHRRASKIYKMNKAACADAMAAELEAAGGEPLLRGGSSYANTYTAGASEARFCAQTLDAESLLDLVRPSRLILVFLLHAPKVLRVLALATVEFFLAVSDFLRGLISRHNLVHELRFIPARVAICVILRETVRFMVKMDIARGVPVIHANLLGYDEQAHRRGPGSRFAHWSLKGIDAVIRDICRSAARSDQRDYEVVIFSDHGQEKVTSYAQARGRLLREEIEAISSQAENAELSHIPARKREKPERMAGNRAWRRGLLTGRAAAPPLPVEPGKLRVTAMGPLGHVYFPGDLDDGQKERLAARFVREAQIPLVLFLRRDGGVQAVNANGQWRLPEDAAEVLGKNHPFLDMAAADLARVCARKWAGTFVVSGWRPEGTPVSFPVENGAHGGPGAAETGGFLILPEALASCAPKPPGTWWRPLDLRECSRSFLSRREPPVRKPTDRPEPARHLRVITYNIHSCIGLDGKNRPARIARIIEKSGADIAALQEVDAGRPRTGRDNQAELIAGFLGMRCVFCPVVEREGEQYGLAVISRFPIRRVRAGPFPGPSSRREERGMLWVEADLGTVRIQFINTHLGLNRRERLAHTRELLNVTEEHRDGALVLCGDLNAGRRSRPYRLLSARLRDVRQGAARPFQGTFYSMRPIFSLDHIFVRGPVQVDAVEIIRHSSCKVASDHLPLRADLSLPQAGGKQ